ncbi:MAG: septum formation initiator family protein [Holophagae bacterium]|nr:septum formation initiator family protein [Holophagae bacterium]
MRRKMANRSRNFIFLSVLLACYLLAWAAIIYSMADGYKTYISLKQRREALLKEESGLKERMDEIRRKSEMRRADSPFFVEMVAREKLKMAKKGEVIIKVVKDDKTTN